MEKTISLSGSSSIPQVVIGETVAAGERQVMLSGPQDQALEWLMSGGSIGEAAEVAGVCRQTVSRWLHSDADFRAVYDAWRQQVATITEGQLLGLSESAVAAIAATIRERRDLRAAEFVLKHLAGIAKGR